MSENKIVWKSLIQIYKNSLLTEKFITGLSTRHSDLVLKFMKAQADTEMYTLKFKQVGRFEYAQFENNVFGFHYDLKCIATFSRG